MPFQRLPHIFGVQQLNGTIANNARCKWKSETNVGGRQTGSRCRRRGRAVGNASATPRRHLGVSSATRQRLVGNASARRRRHVGVASVTRRRRVGVGISTHSHTFLWCILPEYEISGDNCLKSIFHTLHVCSPFHRRRGPFPG